MPAFRRQPLDLVPLAVSDRITVLQPVPHGSAFDLCPALDPVPGLSPNPDPEDPIRIGQNLDFYRSAHCENPGTSRGPCGKSL
jgi:hypothetical protein